MWAVENAGAGRPMQHEDGLATRVTCFLDSEDPVTRRMNESLHGTQQYFGVNRRAADSQRIYLDITDSHSLLCAVPF
jgi:hypothetical protein